MGRTNVELKARDRDPAATLARLASLGAREGGVLRQRDTYFAGARGRLKLREEDGADAKLIAYRRPDAPGPEASAYTRAPLRDAAAVREALDRALGTTVVVTKTRRLFLWRGVRIHLDEVEGLGSYLEFEAPFARGAEPGRSGDSQADAEAKVAELRAALAVADDALVAVGYCDLLSGGREAPLARDESA